MSYFQFQQRCSDCGKTWWAAFGVVNTSIIAQPPKACPDCGSAKIETVKPELSEEPMSKSEEPTTHKDWCLSFYRRPCNCGAEQLSTPPSPEDLYGRGIDSEIVKSQLEFRQKMSPPPSPSEATEEKIAQLEWQLAGAEDLNKFFRDSVGECHVMISRNTSEYQIRKEWDSTDLPPRLQKVMQRAEAAEAKNRAQVEEIAEQIERAGMIPSATVKDIVDAYLFSKEQLKACSDLRDSEAEEAAEEIAELKNTNRELNRRVQSLEVELNRQTDRKIWYRYYKAAMSLFERATERAESLELQLSEQRALMGEAAIALGKTVNFMATLAAVEKAMGRPEQFERIEGSQTLTEARAVLAKLGKKEK